MHSCDFKTAAYFPFHMILLGGGLAIIGLSMLTMGYFIGGPIVLLISVLLLTTHYRCRVDFEKKEYQDYVWVLGIKSGEKVPFDEIQYIFIKQSQQSQTMGLRASSTTIHKSVFDAYLKFSETDKIHLLTKDKKENLVNTLRPIANKLGTKMIDYTTGDPKIIL